MGRIEDAYSRYEIAKGLLDKGEYAGAIREALLSIERAVESRPSCAAGWTKKGLILLRMNRIAESLGAVEKALDLDSRLSEAWFRKAYVMAVLGHNDEAIKCLDRAIELSPEVAFPYFGKGEVLKNMDKFTEALDSVEEGLKRNPKKSCAWCLKGMILDELGRYSEALDSYDKSLDLAPPRDCIMVLLCKGATLISLERIPEAKDLVRTVDENKIKGPYSLNIYAWLLYSFGEFKKGIEISRKAVEMESDIAYFWDTLACNLQGAKSDSEAVEAFEKAVSLKKTDDAISWGVLAELYERMGRHEEADQAKQKSKKTSKHNNNP